MQVHWGFSDWLRINKGKNMWLHTCFHILLFLIIQLTFTFLPTVWFMLSKTHFLQDWHKTKTQITTCNHNTTNSPVCRHLNQLPIKCSAEGGDNGDERQETPCTVLACQACLEPKHLGKRQRRSGREMVEGREGQGEKKGEKSRNENSALYRSNHLLDPHIKTCQLTLSSYSF